MVLHCEVLELEVLHSYVVHGNAALGRVALSSLNETDSILISRPHRLESFLHFNSLSHGSSCVSYRCICHHTVRMPLVSLLANSGLHSSLHDGILLRLGHLATAFIIWVEAKYEVSI